MTAPLTTTGGVTPVSAGPTADQAPPARSAVIPLHPRFRPGQDVCVVVTETAISVIAADVYAALEAGVEPYPDDPPRTAPYSIRAHSHIWTRDETQQFAAPLRHPDVQEFLQWLDDRLNQLWRSGPRELLHQALPHSATDRSQPMPSFHVAVEIVWYSVADAARILDADSAIYSMTQHALFEWLSLNEWISRDNDVWRPQPDALEAGHLTVVETRVPTLKELYPQVCLTPAGLAEIHRRLGGGTPLSVLTQR